MDDLRIKTENDGGTGCELIKGNAGMMEEYISFINIVFGFDNPEKDFRTLHPKLFGENRKSAEDTYFIIENGEIKACVGAFPIEYNICGTDIKMRGIGNVGTRSDCRGSGFMKMLMTRATDDMIKDGIDMSVLGGRRHRYNIHGFEKCDCGMRFHTSKRLFNYILPDFKSEFEVVTLEKDNNSLLDSIYNNLDKLDYRPIRDRENLYDILKTWRSIVYGFYKDGLFKGWAIVNEGGSCVYEFVPLDKSDAYLMAAELVINHNVNMFSVPSFDYGCNYKLMEISENASVECDVCFCVFNWKKVLSALLTLKAKGGIADGELDIEIGGKNEKDGINPENGDDTASVFKERTRLLLKVKNGEVSVTETADKCKKPDFSFSHLEAHRFFFLNYSSERAELPPVLASWFPLPIYIYEVDNV